MAKKAAKKTESDSQKKDKTTNKTENNVHKAESSVSKTEPTVQPEINIGLVGHVDHGKTTLVKALSGKWTDTHSEEVKRGITIRLGYADADIRKCPSCPEPDCYTIHATCDKCKTPAEFLRRVSFVDAPGHESLMATMLSGATIMDGALLLVAANEECPQPQTREHIMALEIMGIHNVIILQNKIDVVSEDRAIRNYNQIKEFIKNTKFKDVPIIPISAQHSVNIDVLIGLIQKYIPTPVRDPSLAPLMFVARSFDINKPGTKIRDIVGGVLGGSLKQGKLKVGDMIQLKPGYSVEEMNQRVWKPIETKVAGLVTGSTKVTEVGPGGSIGLLTTLDPSIVKSDSFTGSVVGLKDKLPEVRYDLELKTQLLERVVGSKEELVVEPIKLGEVLMLNVNSSATVGQVTKLGKNQFQCKLKIPICAEKESRVTISRRVGNRFRLIGCGTIN